MERAMAFQPALQCASAVIQQTYGGSIVNNVLNFHLPSVPVQADLDALAAAVDSGWATYAAVSSAALNYVNTHVRGLTNAIDLESDNNTSAGHGIDTSNALPGNVALVVTLRTGHAGRSARGRVYMSGLSEDILFGGPNSVSSSFAAAAVGVIQSIQSAADVAGWQFVVLSRHSGGVLRPSATFLPISSIAVRNLFTDSQRNRLPVGH